MAYPYMVTLTGAMSNSYDYEMYSFYPRYWFNPMDRFAKYLAEKYDGASRFNIFRSAYGTPSHWGAFRDLSREESLEEYFPLFGSETQPEQWQLLEKITQDYHEFLTTQSGTRKKAELLMPLFLRKQTPEFRAFIRERYETVYLNSQSSENEAPVVKDDDLLEGALSAMAQIRGDRYNNFEAISFAMFSNYPFELPKWIPRLSGRHLDYVDWLKDQPPELIAPVTRRYLWWTFLVKQDIDVSRYNQLAGTVGTDRALDYLEQVSYPVEQVLSPELDNLRTRFLQEGWPVRMSRILHLDRIEYEAVLKEMFGTIKAMNTTAGTTYAAWSEVPMQADLPSISDHESFMEVDYRKLNLLRSAWQQYALTKLAKGEAERVYPELAYQEFLLAKYGSLVAINNAYQRSYPSLEGIELPIRESGYLHYFNNQKTYFNYYVTSNFTKVFGFLVTKGRAFFNTFVLVSLTIIATLTVNPLAAYALSRFRLRKTNQILIFLLATMAFPAEVAMIPSFLLLRDFNMLNTYWALVLPGLASGFSIFLLKGFFDSLPKELYEAASIDGASEARMFLNISLPLCKPILAVIALNAFIAAYGGFMWAFLSCQDPNMWTIMVFLYQFQQTMQDHPSMVMAALVISSIPTLVIFLFCQKIILRGIIIPTMK